MTISIKVGEKPAPAAPIKITVNPPAEMKEEDATLKMKLDLRKAIDGTIMIMDHYEMDITINPTAKKVVLFPKRSYNDEVYAAQSRLFEHLIKAGIVSAASVQGGSIHGALEGAFLESEDPSLSVTDLSVLSVGKFLEKEKPEYVFQKAYEEEIENMYVEPTPEDSTELGEVPQAAKKGSIEPYDVRRYLTGLY